MFHVKHLRGDFHFFFNVSRETTFFILPSSKNSGIINFPLFADSEKWGKIGLAHVNAGPFSISAAAGEIESSGQLFLRKT